MQTVYIIEDEILLRDLLSDLINSDNELEIIGVSDDGTQGLKEALEKSQTF
tara:strand:+ start:3481 stop:3633 length:153 start_codon:yes stop_codon:yes gene_type:complete